MPPRRAASAFTLVELLLVIAIIGILAAIVVTQVGSVRIKARNSEARSNIVGMSKSVELFRNNNSDNILTAITSGTATGGTYNAINNGDTLGSSVSNFDDANFKQMWLSTAATYPVVIAHTPGTGHTYAYKTFTNPGGHAPSEIGRAHV